MGGESEGWIRLGIQIGHVKCRLLWQRMVNHRGRCLLQARVAWSFLTLPKSLKLITLLVCASKLPAVCSHHSARSLAEICIDKPRAVPCGCQFGLRIITTSHGE